ncbi:MAG: hypothetical protein EPO35_01140 [Acidobacteria bacterium]|nr:MAG: hypothetical protein EPO35_01140 [Acidobacteriota bacterium]
MTSSRAGDVLYCEFLSARVLLLTLLPAWLRTRGRVRRCYYVDAGPLAKWLAGVASALSGVSIERLDFRLAEIHDEDGQLIRLRVAYHDMRELRDEVTEQPAFKAFVADARLDEDQQAFLAKSVCSLSLTDRSTMWRTLLVMHAAAWHVRRAYPGASAIALIERRAWQPVLDRYGRGLGLSVVTVRGRFEWATELRHWLGPHRLGRLRRWRDVYGHRRALRRHGVTPAAARAAASGSGLPLTGRPRILVEYLGHFHLKQPEFYSDLFFWQASSLPGEDLVVTFGVPQAPLTPADREALRDAHIAPVALYPAATTAADVPLFTHGPVRHLALPPSSSLEGRWMHELIEEYDATRQYWSGLFAATNAKVFVAWNRFDNRMHPIAAALRARDGATAIYQRSFQPDPAPEMAVRAEIVFGYSPMDAAVERDSGSEIDYHVSVGYSGDHRVPFLRAQAADVRARLIAHGAARIVAFFDENSGNDSRWHTGHELMRVNYEFILERLLGDPTLGLVLKPKRPSTLRFRLGPVAPLLERALATGRCYMYETGPLHGSEPPVAAALAADLVIHGHLCAATAGLEAALAGVPTLLLDREGWPRSVMFRLGRGRVAFTSWTELWAAVEEHWRVRGGIPGFGDWRPFIEELDPFRDGRAAERIGTYLDWVISGYRAGQSRRVVLANAAERYAAAWGADKITRVNPAPGAALPGVSTSNEQPLASVR